MVTVKSFGQGLQTGEIGHNFFSSRLFEGDGQQAVVAHGRHRKNPALAKGVMQHRVPRLPAGFHVVRAGGRGLGRAGGGEAAPRPGGGTARRRGGRAAARPLPGGRRPAPRALSGRLGPPLHALISGPALPVAARGQFGRDIAQEFGGPVAAGGAVQHPGTGVGDEQLFFGAGDGHVA